MPIVHIDLYEGRSIEKKRTLVEKVTQSICEALECPPQAVTILLHDVKKENWAAAGKLQSD